MSRFVSIYHAPQAPADASPSPPEMEEVMGAWNDWAGVVGDRMLDVGTPLGGGVRVASDGTSPSRREVVGYTILEADSMDAALEPASAHPHLRMPGGCEIEVPEAQPNPGT